MGSWRAWFGWARGSGISTIGSGVADEVAAFLGGRCLERLRGRGESAQIAPWMWLNALAHGQWDRVLELAEAAVRPDDVLTWRDVRTLVAREVVARCDDQGRGLQPLQRDVLIPLELRLVETRDLTPGRLAEVALFELSSSGA